MPKPTQHLVTFLRILLLLGGLSGTALATPTTPMTDFTDNGDGTVTHKTTGLTWKRCAEGQTWTGATCSGSAQTYTWTQATALAGSFAGKSDWRLSTIAELVTIVEYDNSPPTINTNIFPGTPPQLFWSASKVERGYAWSVNFNDGNTGSRYTEPLFNPFFGIDGVTTVTGSARLVRGGQPTTSLVSPIFTPTSDFTDHANGTVTHKKTGLMWKRCAEGQTWVGSACSGTATSSTWAQATTLTSNFGGYSDWRLPTENELLSIVEMSSTDPAVNSAIFPGVSSTSFWSASAYAANKAIAWGVDFRTGYTSPIYKSVNYSALLVRAGQSVSPSVHGPDCLFNWAEGYASTIFSPAGSASQTLGTYYYRAYAKSSSYLASSSDGNLYYLEKNSGLLNLGPLTQWYVTAGCQL